MYRLPRLVRRWAIHKWGWGAKQCDLPHWRKMCLAEANAMDVSEERKQKFRKFLDSLEHPFDDVSCLENQWHL
jgi:hypothetical protein